MLDLLIFPRFKQQYKFIQESHEHGASLHVVHFPVQAVRIIFIRMFILFQVDAVFPVDHNHAYPVRSGKVQPELAGDFLHVFVIDLIAKQQIVEIISRFLILHPGLHDQAADALGNVHERSSLPADVKQGKFQLVCPVDHALGHLLPVVHRGNSQAGDAQFVQLFHAARGFFVVKSDIIHHDQREISPVHVVRIGPGLYHIRPGHHAVKPLFPGNQLHAVQFQI